MSSGQMATAAAAASSTSWASISSEDSSMPWAGHWQTKRIGPAGGRGAHQKAWENRRSPPSPLRCCKTLWPGSPSGGLRCQRSLTLLPSEKPMPNRNLSSAGSLPTGPPRPRMLMGTFGGLSRLTATTVTVNPAGKATSPARSTAKASLRTREAGKEDWCPQGVVSVALPRPARRFGEPELVSLGLVIKKSHTRIMARP